MTAATVNGVRALRIAVIALALTGVGAPGAAYAQVVTTPTQPPETQPPATEPPATTPPVTEPATTAPATAPPPTRARTTVTRSRSTTSSSTSSTKPGPTTTIFVIPGDAGPVTTAAGSTTIATIPQNDQIPTWATNLFWVGIAGMLAIMITTFVMTGRK